MNKKFFTLLVSMLLTICMGVSAQGLSFGAATNYTTGNSYLLTADAGANFIALDANGQLTTVAAATVTDYPSLQRALWTVIHRPASATNAAPTSEFLNVAMQIPLSLTQDEKAFTAFIPASGQFTPAATRLYVYQEDGVKVWNIDVDPTATPPASKVSLVEGANNTVNAGSLIAPWRVTGNIDLTANDINTYLGKQGIYSPTGFIANENSRFQLNITPDNTLPNPFDSELQAWGLTPVTNTATGVRAGLIDGTITPVANGYRDMTQTWVLLKSADKFVVVDTLIIEGTKQWSTPLQNTTVDALPAITNGVPNAASKRLKDSYVFKFRYNAETNSVSVLSKAYMFNENDVPAADPEKWDQADVNIGTNLVAGNVFQYDTRYDFASNIISAAYGGTPGDAGWEAWTIRNPYRNYLTYATLEYDGSRKAVVYSWGVPGDINISLDASAWYVKKQLTSGVYLLQVVSADARRNGKYKKVSMGGSMIEDVELQVRQNFQHIPSAQWVIDASNNYNARITNREFEYQYLQQASRVTYAVAGQTDQFFYLGGDTLKLIPVTADNRKDPYLGYYKVKENDFEYLNKFALSYLHELMMNQPVALGNDVLNTLKVAKEGEANYFRLEKVSSIDYGYGEHLRDVAQLNRTAYRIAVYDAMINGNRLYVTYDIQDKKYHMTDDVTEASIFYLKENNEVSGDDPVCYYTLLEANTYEGDFVVIDPADAKVITYYGGSLPWNFTYPGTGSVVLANTNGTPRAFDTQANAAAATPTGVLTTPIQIGNSWYAVLTYADLTAYYYRSWLTYNVNNNYASSKVSVDNNTLILTNGVLEDVGVQEVANSAFALTPDRSVLYRELGLVEGEVATALEGAPDDEDSYLVKFFRANATQPEYLYEDANSPNYSEPVNGPSATRTSQINFLGVEGKGDEMFDKAAMIARYVRGTVMPHYLIMVDYNHDPGYEQTCPVCDAQGFITPGCPHHGKKDAYSTARVLITLTDSINAYNTQAGKDKFRWNQHTRLAFADAIFTDGDSTMIFLNEYKDAQGNYNQAAEKQVKFVNAAQMEGPHTNYMFSFRLIDSRYTKENPADYNDFLIETERTSTVGGMTANTWIKVQNGVPVIVQTSYDNAIKSEAERWNLESTTDEATSNEGIEAGTIKVTAGTGSVTIKGAAGKQAVISNILGKVVANVNLSSDEVTIDAPAGVIVIAIDGEVVKALVK